MKGNHSSHMTNKTGMQEHLSMLATEDNKKVPEIEPDSVDSEEDENFEDCIDDWNVLTSTLTDAPLESSTQNQLGILKVSDSEQYDGEDNKKVECGNIADCVEDGNGLPSTRVGLAIEELEENLLTISLSTVHLVDRECSVEVGKGDFSFVRHIVQGSTDLAMVAKVGEHLRWSISKDLSVFKLDNSHYLFYILSKKNETFEIVEDSVKLTDVTPAEVLNYVVSFQGENQSLELLDKLLGQHAQFTDSTSDSTRSEVEGYTSRLVKAIDAGTGKLVKGLFFVIEAYSSQLEKFRKHVMDRMDAKLQPSDITKTSEKNPDRLMRTIERLRKIAKATEKISENLLIGMYNLPSLVVSGKENQSEVCQKMYRTLPVEMIIVSWDSLNKIIEAVEEAAKSALISTSAVASDIVRHRFGERVGRVTEETLAVAGHSMGTAYNIYKIIRPVSISVKYLGKASMGVKYLGKALQKVVG